jgi:hypothetical protein
MATHAEREDVRAERQYLYEHFTAPLSGKHRKDLKPNAEYMADPDSRYARYQDRALDDYAASARAVRLERERATRDRERSRSPRRGTSFVAS